MSNTAPFPIASGYLPSGTVLNDKSQYTTNCVGVHDTNAGAWIVNLNGGVLFDITKHIVTANIVGIATADPTKVDIGAAGQGGIGLFAARDIGAGFVPSDLAIHFTVHERPKAI